MAVEAWWNGGVEEGSGERRSGRGENGGGPRSKRGESVDGLEEANWWRGGRWRRREGAAKVVRVATETEEVSVEERNEGENVEESKEEGAVVGDCGVKMKLEVKNGEGKQEAGDEGTNVEESKEEVSGEKVVAVGDDGVKREELEVENSGAVVEELRRKEEEKVGNSGVVKEGRNQGLRLALDEN